MKNRTLTFSVFILKTFHYYEANYFSFNFAVKPPEMPLHLSEL